MYKSIKSSFVKHELKKTAWENREYIEELMRIEALATDVYKGVIVWHWTHHYSCKYPTQWKVIWKELNPSGYKEWFKENQKEEARHQREIAAIEREEKEELQQDRKEWKEMCGK